MANDSDRQILPGATNDVARPRFNLLVSVSAGALARARREVVATLRAVGDGAPIVEPTERRGLLAVSTSLDPRAAVRALRERHHQAPAAFRFTLRWTPVDLWTGADLESLRRAVTQLGTRIAPGERWRMNAERRAPGCPAPSEIIGVLANLIDNKVDLDNPDKILRVELFSDRAALAVVTPEETLSVLGAQRRPQPVGFADQAGAFVSGPVVLEDAALFTDLYELTMAASYLREEMNAEATFSLFVRKLPRERSFLVAAGLTDVLAFLERFRFSEAALDYLRSLRMFEPSFLHFLAGLRFTGTVRAVPEGTVVFGDEPLLEVTAPLIEAQIVETAVMNVCHLQTLLTSKAVRSVIAAAGRAVVDFGLRRTHGVDAGMKAARCAYIAGATMSSNVLAGHAFGIPPTGTMAHSYVEAFPHEIDAFRAFARSFPARTTLLIDTYDTVAAARKAVVVARELEARGARLAGVRLDSGDLVQLSRDVRRILDDAGLGYVSIFASGGLDEDELQRCIAAGAPINAFGVGTRMNTSADAPYLDMAYKLVRYAGRNVLKLSPGKKTWTGEKQVYRRRDVDGRLAGDEIALRDEPPRAGAETLLRTVLRDGRAVGAPPTLGEIRARCAAQVAALPDDVRRLHDATSYAVSYSSRLMALQETLERETEATEVVGG